ncbi:adenylosuccinate lyase [Christensenellaceae bacterium]|nr:adenylosuccinate lyase [Christensenellaceae bacterium]BDF61022.1 adenylosuccinate lyase [Christensenellaceae bacterium]
MRDVYENPLITRYASREMSHIFSDDMKFKTWRRLWIALAEAESEMGLPITKEQIAELKEHAEDINYDVAEAREKEVRHDVMSHVYAYGMQCPSAKGIIHLGATSCFVGDNTDIIVMDHAIRAIELKLVNVIARLKEFALQYKDMPTLGFTHYQPAQLTTVGKRATLWMQDLVMDYEQLQFVKSQIRLRGVKGTTGTQASFLTLFEGDAKKVRELEQKVAKKMGYSKVFAVTGQTYPRKFDSIVVDLLSSIAQSAYKFANDLRLLQNLKEVEEPFGKKQIGSSAMAYKRNPMRSERICSLARYIISLASSPAITASTQWFERTLDDSANKRLVIPQGFLALDAILNIYLNVTSGMVVYPKVIEKRINEELPFMATETILMDAVKRGGDRQELHEKIREYSMMAGRRVKEEGKSNNLIDLIKEDPAFHMSPEEIDSIMDPRNFIGLADKQVDDFIRAEADPILECFKGKLAMHGEVSV